MIDLLRWEKDCPGGSLEGGIELANRLDWGLTVQMAGLEYVVSSGGEPILRTDSKDALQTFIYGLGLAYAVLPEDLFIGLEAAVEEL